MKRFLLPLAVVSVLLTGCKSGKGRQLLLLLEDSPETGMLVYNRDTLTSYHAPGVQDLLELVSSDPGRLRGAIVADRRVGKAAAALLINGGVKSIHTPLVSTPARLMIEEAGIPLFAREEIPFMTNTDGSALCPMEKKLLEASSVEECLVLLHGGSLTGCGMLDMLNEQGLSLLVYNNDSLSVHANRGVRDLLELVSSDPGRLRGAIVADKITGKAAAALMAYAGAKEIHTNIICTPARELLEKEGIRVFATEEVPMILNSDKSSMCPIDTQIADIESIDECVAVLQARLAH